MMHVSVMMLSYAALLVGALMAIAYLVITWGRDVPLQGSSWGSGGDRRKPIPNNPGTILEDILGNPIGNTLADNPSNVVTNVVTNFPVSNPGNTTTLANLPATILATPDLVLKDNALNPQLLSLAETLDNISYRIIGLGFPLLTIGIIAGAVWANEAWGSYWSWDPKETWALITWLVFAAYLHARITRGWQGKKPAIIAATGFMVVWICYLGVNLLGKGLHSYGWFL
jgi:cytochrome c-type biogenesis protein CcsB